MVWGQMLRVSMQAAVLQRRLVPVWAELDGKQRNRAQGYTMWLKFGFAELDIDL